MHAPLSGHVMAEENSMYAPRFFVSMMCALLVFAIATYIIHGSFYTAFLQTVLCLVIIQVGYFIGVLLMVAKEQKRMQQKYGFSKEAGPSAEKSGTENLPPIAHSPKLSDF